MSLAKFLNQYGDDLTAHDAFILGQCETLGGRMPVAVHWLSGETIECYRPLVNERHDLEQLVSKHVYYCHNGVIEEMSSEQASEKLATYEGPRLTIEYCPDAKQGSKSRKMSYVGSSTLTTWWCGRGHARDSVKKLILDGNRILSVTKTEVTHIDVAALNETGTETLLRNASEWAVQAANESDADTPKE